VFAVAQNDRARTPVEPALRRNQPAPLPPRHNTVWDAIATSSLLGSRPRVQAKLTISQPGDPYEQDADRTADEVMRTPEPTVQRKCAACGTGREPCPQCEAEQGAIYRKPDAPSSLTSSDAAGVVSHLGPGRPLDPATRTFMEERFDCDFSHVRLHNHGKADESARRVHARAFTVGRDVVFGPGSYVPGTTEGRRLIAHELTHVIQQSSGRTPIIQRQIKVPVFDEFDPCVSVEGHTVCGSDAKKACEKIPSLPGCSTVCKVFGCKKPEQPSAVCPPGFHAAGSTNFTGQCCTDRTIAENKSDCCPPARAAFKEGRCCAEDEMVQGGVCIKGGDFPVPPGMLCLPGQTTSTGVCCTLPLVPKGAECVLPETPPPTPKPKPTLKETEIFFKRDRPAPGEITGGALKGSATSEGLKNFEALIANLRADPLLRVQLVGKASPDGTVEYNQALGERRAQMVRNALMDAGISDSRLADPPTSGLDPDCETLAPGMANCGERGATGDRDRQVRARVFGSD